MGIEEFRKEDLDFNINGLKFLLYGAPRSGKTWFIGTMEDPYIICLDKGLIGLQLAGKTPRGCTVDTFEDLEEVIAEIAGGVRAKDASAIALDHLSAVSDLVTNYVKRRASKSTMDRSTWGIAADHVRMFVNSFVDIADIQNKHVCMTAHQKIEKNDVIGSVLGTPDTIGKFAMSVGGLFDLYLYCMQEVVWKDGDEKVEWKVRTANFEAFTAGDRTGVLDVNEPNDFPTIYKKIKDRVDALKREK